LLKISRCCEELRMLIDFAAKKGKEGHGVIREARHLSTNKCALGIALHNWVVLSGCRCARKDRYLTGVQSRDEVFLLQQRRSRDSKCASSIFECSGRSRAVLMFDCRSHNLSSSHAFECYSVPGHLMLCARSRGIRENLWNRHHVS